MKKEYQSFNKWWENISKEGRTARIYKIDDQIGAILILKDEEEAIASEPSLPKKKRLKICTLNVLDTGKKIGELFIKMAVEYAINNSIDEIYLTHFTKENEYLFELLAEFGFQIVAKKADGEDIYQKNLVPVKSVNAPIDISRIYYPSFYDGENVRKFVIPIQPEYHRRLFIDDLPEQLSLNGMNEMIVEKNTIKKAYLSYSRIKGLHEGDVILFYRSVDIQGITTIGIVERVYANTKDENEIIRFVGKRSVYTASEISEMAQKPTKVIIFRFHFLLNPISLDILKEEGILRSAPQSIQEISHEKYVILKKIGGIDERFTFDKTEIRQENH